MKKMFEEQDTFKREEIVGRDVLRNVLMETKIAEFLPIKKVHLHSLVSHFNQLKHTKDENRLLRAGD